MPDLVLASSSPYRRQLLNRLAIPFQWATPNIDEASRDGETAEQLTLRLALEKAKALAGQFPNHLIIGSDQVVLLNGSPVSKPGEHSAAVNQLRQSSGKTVKFITSICLLNSRSGQHQLINEPFTVHFRELDDECIERYLQIEKPYDCAGSFKAEGLGISLFRAMQGDDPNSLIGLPLIRLCDMLRNEGLAIP
ncbi:MAG TPA: septum formation inhibitor Maf [Pseudomonas xinjiangensis]|uniref:7-methyl-GTP pyrophosphatase n=2 Tax=root TaxID=1 RepID=A0A7V1BQH9_9GAMM|nr:septum formation inhibitor Maf [Halopseudomonas xinjiangensis]HEC46778.1 septum formation inhibitor Maf [Halopseudomonas xinjiangensis]